MVICYFVIVNNSEVFLTLSHHPGGKYVGKGPVMLFHNVIFIVLNKFSQQMQIHPHLSYYINLPKRINKKKYKTIIRIYEIYNPFNCNNNLLETTSIQNCREQGRLGSIHVYDGFSMFSRRLSHTLKRMYWQFFVTG